MRSRDLEFMRSRGQEIYTDTNSPFCDADIYAHIHVDYMVRGLTTLVASTHCLFDLKFYSNDFNEHSFKHCLGSLAGIIFYQTTPWKRTFFAPKGKEKISLLQEAFAS